MQSNARAAYAAAAATWPDAEVAVRLNPQLTDCSFVFQSLNSRIFELGDCFVAQADTQRDREMNRETGRQQ